jgi:hypothetical protein
MSGGNGASHLQNCLQTVPKVSELVEPHYTHILLSICMSSSLGLKGLGALQTGMSWPYELRSTTAFSAISLLFYRMQNSLTCASLLLCTFFSCRNVITVCDELFAEL